MMGLDVNGYDNRPEWGYCHKEGCKEEAFPIWKSGDYPDDPDLLLCPKHIGETIGQMEADRAALMDAIGNIGRIARRPDGLAFQAIDALARRILEQAHSGAALLAELEAARAVAQELAAGIARDGYCPICHQTERVTLQTGYYTHHEGCALAAYDQAMKARDA